MVHHVDATSFAAMDQLAQTTAQTFADPVESRAAFAQSAGENAASIWGQLVGGAFRSDASGTAGGYYGLHTGYIFDTDVNADRGWVAGLQAGRVSAPQIRFVCATQVFLPMRMTL
ncbi:MAG: hypothetical protein ABJN34_05600 [Litoreibacter sp.]|uniref:hypothetical protein n=1 Tax=Litoreibacter sp. TaxID=1969459 RepID=UPI0032983F51